MSKQSGVGTNDQTRIVATCRAAREMHGTDKQANCQMISEVLNAELGTYWNVFIYDVNHGAGYKWYSNDKQIKFEVDGWCYDIFQTTG